MADADSISILAVGDVFIDIDDGLSAFQDVRSLLACADLVIGNSEGVYCDRPAISPVVRHAMVSPRSRSKRLAEVPFHMMSCANNHIMDGGYHGLSDTLDALKSQGILVAGAGNSVEEAFTPAIATTKGRKVAMLSVASVFPIGHEARGDRPGLAALRIRTHYATPDPTFWEPGLPGHISTEADAEDLARLDRAVASAKASADLLVVTCHWGVSNRYRTLEPYEVELATHIIDSGADAVLCHHHHSLRPVRFHRGKPIFQGLGAFVQHMRHYNASPAKSAASKALFAEYAHGPREGYPLFPFHPLARKTGAAWLEFDENGALLSTGLFPGLVQPDGGVLGLRYGDVRATEIAQYLREITAAAAFTTDFGLENRDGRAYIAISDARQAA